MSFIKTNFTDPQGSVFEEAYFEVSTAHINKGFNESYNNRISLGTEEVNGHGNTNLSYQMYYWPSEAARNEGGLPYLLANLDPMGDTFYANELGSEYDELSALEAAELHCQTVVLA